MTLSERGSGRRGSGDQSAGDGPSGDGQRHPLAAMYPLPVAPPAGAILPMADGVLPVPAVAAGLARVLAALRAEVDAHEKLDWSRRLDCTTTRADPQAARVPGGRRPRVRPFPLRQARHTITTVSPSPRSGSGFADMLWASIARRTLRRARCRLARWWVVVKSSSSQTSSPVYPSRSRRAITTRWFAGSVPTARATNERNSRASIASSTESPRSASSSVQLPVTAWMVVWPPGQPKIPSRHV